jgi:hypothetical protein
MNGNGTMLILASVVAASWNLINGAEMSSPELVGTSRSVLDAGSSAMIPGQSVSGGRGMAVQGVNLYTGQPTYSIPLGGVSTTSLGFPVTLNYAGPTKPIVQNDNERAPTSWVGLGFNLTIPYVSVNHKGTYTRSDDVFYCDLGPYGGGELLSSNGTDYSLSTNPYIKVFIDTGVANTDEQGQVRHWLFEFPDGKRMSFGEDAASRRYVLYHEGAIRAPVYSASGLRKFTYRWDISAFWDSPPLLAGHKNSIRFDYDYLLTASLPGKSYVSEGYVKNIKWMVGGQEADRYEFKTAPKGANEYVGYASDEPRNDQKLFETRRLDTLKCFKEGSLAFAYKFDWTAQSKGLLSEVRVLRPDPATSALIPDNGWSFNYDASRFFLLNRVIAPSSRKDSLIYGKLLLGSTAGAQDATDYAMLRKDNVTEVPLPSGTADRALWSVENTCDERFCYSVVRDGDTQTLPGDTHLGTPFSKKVYVEVKRNTGNYFDPRATDDGEKATLRLELGHPANGEKDWKIIPSGDYLLVAGEKTGTVDVWEYDGVRWMSQSPFAGDPHWSGGFNSPIRVYPSSNYFIVQKMQNPSVLIVALRASHGWTSLNRTTCQFSNKAWYGDAIRASQTGSECLEWSTQDLIITPSQNFFSVLNELNDVFCVYALSRDGNGFTEISDKIGPATGPANLQNPLYLMNWERDVVSVVSSGENLFIQSAGSPPWLHGFYFDGHDLVQTMNASFPGSGPVLLYPAKDYLLVAEPKGANGAIDFFPRKARANGKPYFESADSRIVRSDWNSAWNLQIRTHRKAFSIEYYPDSASVGLRPKWEADQSTKYRSYLYQVGREFADGFVSRTSQLSAAGFNLFNISFSGSDNVLTATYASKSPTERCDENPSVWPCRISRYSARFYPDDATTFISGVSGMASLTYSEVWNAQKQSQDALSNCARLVMRTTLDTVGSVGRVRYRQYQFTGEWYSTPGNQYVVSDVISSAALAEEDRNRIWHRISYAPMGSGTVPLGIAEFNSHLQTPQFEFADVAQINSAGTSLGVTRTHFNLDSYANNLTGKRASLKGTEKRTERINNLGQTVFSSHSVTESYRNPAWPAMLFINRPRATITRTSTWKQGFMEDTTYYLGYCDTNASPRFTLRNSRPGKIHLTQHVFDALGLATRTMAFNLSTQPDTAALRTWPNATMYSGTPISGSKTVYDRYYFVRDSVWIDKDQSLTDAELRSGRTPVFNWAEGWFLASEVTRRDDSSFQIMERKAVKNGMPGAQGESYTSTFFEGLRQNPVATVRNARLSDCAVLMAENGNAAFTGNRLDYRHAWGNAGGTFTSVRSHTGRYSIKVVDNLGPIINLNLKDVRALGYGFKISAWIYSDSGTPFMAIERRQSNGEYLDGVSASPLSGSAGARKVWQRWEARYSNAQLIAGNMFNGNNDYLRMYIGLGASTGNSARVVYVDDIVCLPSTADFTLATYDKNGTATSVTGGNFLPTFYDIGSKGNVIAVRDDKFRIFSQTAVHKMGEN